MCNRGLQREILHESGVFVKQPVDTGGAKGHNRRVSQRKVYLFVLLIFLAGCLPIPDVRVDLNLPAATYRFAPERVGSEYVSVPGFALPNSPERYNRALYMRYFTPDSEEATRTVLILVPGIFSGAASP